MRQSRSGKGAEADTGDSGYRGWAKLPAEGKWQLIVECPTAAETFGALLARVQTTAGVVCAVLPFGERPEDAESTRPATGAPPDGTA
jgi:hypothetical protein